MVTDVLNFVGNFFCSDLIAMVLVTTVDIIFQEFVSGDHFPDKYQHEFGRTWLIQFSPM